MQRIELEEALMEEGREEEEKRPHLVNLPSFGASPGDRLFASAVDREMDGDDGGYHDDDGDDDDDDDDFEFAIAAAGPDPAEPAITADELFSGGRILPSYPLFNLDLLLPPAAADPSPPEAGAAARSGSISSSSSSSEAAAAEEDLGFCAWAPRSAPQSPERRAQKSASTGSSSSSPARRWRIRDLVVGRSSSDGKDKFHFVSSPPNPNPNTSPNPNPNPNPKKKGTKVVKEMDMATAHKLYYAKGGGGGGGGGGERGRRSFLPYRQELFGIFASRTHHPF